MDESKWTPKLRFAIKLILVGLFVAIAGFAIDIMFQGLVGKIGHFATVIGILISIAGGVVSFSTYVDD